ncbi:MAG: hypothetical protein KIT58_02275 [Planctomycetota bacterium]|nr:hypothetical protein [Planctomycetota bacterium]
MAEGVLLAAALEAWGRYGGPAARHLDDHSLEDLAQDVLVQLLTRDHGGVDAPGAYVARLWSNLAKSELRRRSRQATPELDRLLEDAPELEPSGCEPDAFARRQRDELSVALNSLLGDLRPVPRAALVFLHLHALGAEDAATLLRSTGAAVRQAASRALRELRARRTHAAQAVTLRR